MSFTLLFEVEELIICELKAVDERLLKEQFCNLSALVSLWLNSCALSLSASYG